LTITYYTYNPVKIHNFSCQQLNETITISI
jgi:hypothetical protein